MWAALRWKDKYFHSDSVLNLIQGVYEHDPAMARAILRRRIYTSEPYSEISWTMVKVAACRVTFDLERVPEALYSEALDVAVEPRLFADFSELCAVPRLVIPDRAARLDYLYSKLPSADELAVIPLRERNRRVACGIFDSDTGLLIALSKNENSVYRTWHAELRLVQAILRAHAGLLPPAWEFYVTLKPCRMCAAALIQLVPDGKAVYYRDEDPGPSARLTILERQGRLIRL